MKNELDLTVVIPAYLEEENLRVLLPRLTATLAQTKLTHEVLIIDTLQPMDETKSVTLLNNCIYLPREGGNMYGDAVRTGIAKARGSNIIFMDADGSHSPEFCLKMLAHRGQHDVVIASRYIDGGSTDNSKVQIMMSKIVNVLYSVILGLNCKDVSNSFKMYRADLVRDLELRCNNFDIIEEILFKMKKANSKVSFFEIPFNFKERMFGHTKRNLLAFVFSYIVTILRLRFSK